MVGDQDSEQKPKGRKAAPGSDAYLPPDESEPLTTDGKRFSDKYTAEGIASRMRGRESTQWHRQVREQEAEQGRTAAVEAASEYLRKLPEFSGSSEARIDRVSRGVVRAISKATNIEPRR
jgi:hypothetical protein